MEINKNERVNLVLDRENKFFNKTLETILNAIKTNEHFINLIKNLCNVDIREVNNDKKLFSVLKDYSSQIQKELETYRNALQLLDGSDVKDKARVIKVINENFEIDENYVGQLSAVEIIRSNNEIGAMYAELYNFAIDIEEYKTIINKIEHPIKLFNKIIDINSEIKNDMKEMISGEPLREMMDYLLGDDFENLLSVENLKTELSAAEETKAQKIAEKQKSKAYENANGDYEKIANDIETLKQIQIGESELLQIMVEKESFDKQFRIPFVQVDDEVFVSFAIEKLKELKNQITVLKLRIAAVLEYAGADVRDVLRDSQPYIIRDYIEKLGKMSKKYDRLFAESNVEDSQELLKLYKKSMDLYATIEEMRNNAYVVDSARFMK